MAGPSYHFYSQTKYDFYDVLCTYFFSPFLCVCIKGHSVDDWVILAVLLRSGVLFFFLSWGAHFFQNWLWHQLAIRLLQNGVRGKLVCCTDSIGWWGCYTNEVKQSYSRSKGAPCFELKCVYSNYKLNEFLCRVAAIKYTLSSCGIF